jgi:hypothetical protein
MATKKVVIEFEFEEIQEDPEDDWTELKLISIRRSHSDLTKDELDQLGETIGQSDSWQVDRWMDIQDVLGGTRKRVKF